MIETPQLVHKIISTNNLKDNLLHYNSESNLKNLNPYDRFIAIVRNITENHELIKAVKKEIHKLNSDDKKTDLNYTIQQYVKSQFLNLEKSLLHIYNFDLTNSKIENGISIFNNVLFFPVSVIIFDFKTWKNLISYELQIVKNDMERLMKIESYINLLNDLKYRLSDDKLLKLYVELKVNSEAHSNYLSIFPLIKFKEVYVSEYIDFLINIDLKELKNLSLLKLKKAIQNDIRLNLELDKLNKKNKFNLQNEKKISLIKKGFSHLIKIQNKEKDNIRELSEILTDSLFNHSKSSTSKITHLDIEFSKSILVDFILFLEKNKYLDETIKYSIPKILNTNLSSIFKKGFSEKNLYVLISNRKNKKLNFDNLTSEIRLKNEMFF